MSQINETTANSLADFRTTLYDSAVLKDSNSVTVATYSVSASLFAAATGGEAALSSTVSSTALADADFDAANGTLTLSGPGGEEEVITAGGPGSNADVTVENDLQSATGEVFEGKACNLTGLTLAQPYL